MIAPAGQVVRDEGESRTLIKVDIQVPLLRKAVRLDQLGVLLSQLVPHGAQLILGKLPEATLGRLPVVCCHSS